MNDNARALYDDLMASRLENFNMRHWWCGTPLCIGGHAESRMPGGIRFNECGTFMPRPEEEVAAWLGLTPQIGAALFYPKPEVWGRLHANAYTATQPEAAVALKRACELSEVKAK